MDRWHQMDSGKVMDAFQTSTQGLSSGSASTLLKQFGPNQLEEKKKNTVIMMFLDQFKDFMILVLITAAVISGVIGELSDTIAIVVIVVLNAVIGFIQEYRAEQAMAALKKLAVPMVKVLRGGRPEIAVEITEGLAAGATVLRGTVGVLRDGTPVKLPAGPAAPASAAAATVPASSAVR